MAAADAECYRFRGRPGVYMHHWTCRIWFVSSVSAVLAGCGSDCDDATRLDGDWSVTTSVVGDDWQITGFNTNNADPTVATSESLAEGALLAQVLTNGERTWTLQRDGASDDYRLRIEGQEFQARLVPQQGSCNAFDFDFEGTWNGAEGSAHLFALEGQLTFLGDEMTGEWKYSDSFTWDAEDRNGTIAIPAGVLSATRGATDSGL